MVKCPALLLIHLQLAPVLTSKGSSRGCGGSSWYSLMIPGRGTYTSFSQKCACVLPCPVVVPSSLDQLHKVVLVKNIKKIHYLSPLGARDNSKWNKKPRKERLIREVCGRVRALMNTRENGASFTCPGLVIFPEKPEKTSCAQLANLDISRKQKLLRECPN